LQTLGYSEGRNIALEFRYSGGRSDRAGEIATEFVRLGVDVIVAHFTPAVRAALGATQTIPIVMAPAGAPLQSGFIESLARPGGNVTGLSAMDAEIGGKRLQLLGDLIPSLARVAVLASTLDTDPFGGPFVENLRLAATRTGLRLVPALVSGPNEFESAFAVMAKADAQAVIIQGLFDPHRAILVEFATKHRLALMSGSRETTAAGGVISISANFPLLYERSAEVRIGVIKRLADHVAGAPGVPQKAVTMLQGGMRRQCAQLRKRRHAAVIEKNPSRATCRGSVSRPEQCTRSPSARMRFGVECLVRIGQH